LRPTLLTPRVMFHLEHRGSAVCLSVSVCLSLPHCCVFHPFTSLSLFLSFSPSFSSLLSLHASLSLFVCLADCAEPTYISGERGERGTQSVGGLVSVCMC